MKPKTYIIIFLSAVIAVVVFHLLVWNFLTKDILTGEIGDLSRMGYLPEMAMRKNITLDLPLRHMEAWSFDKGGVDVLTVGDSFSNGADRLKNGYYQDYIATFNNLRVLNVLPYDMENPVATVVLLHNSGWLAKYSPGYVIIEKSEKSSIDSFDKAIDFSKSARIQEVEDYMKAGKNVYFQSPNVDFINTGNVKYLIYRLLYAFSENAYFGRVHVLKLDRALFTAGRGDTLLVLNDDLNGIPLATSDSVKRLNDNMNRLADMLKEDGIRLLFMPVVDKYNLYMPYIINNRHPASAFFELLRPLPKRYELIDTKAILSKELEKGELDVFTPDDTHWSWKASKRIFEETIFD